MAGLANSRWALGNTHRSGHSWSGNQTARTTSTTTTTVTTFLNDARASSLPTTPRTEAPTAANGSSNTIDASAFSRIPTPAAELARYTKIVRRLRWKLPYLAEGYRQATNRALATTDEGRAHMAEAELMFKLDFFEYYSMLERALVHLLGVFGIAVPRGFSSASRRQQEQARARINNGHGNGNREWSQGDHRFHSNLLEALDDPNNPLHEVLGQGYVRDELARAKELRHRWKNADDVDGLTNGRNGKAVQDPLEVYDLDRMLDTTFEGFDRGFLVADTYVHAVQQAVAANGMVDQSTAAVSENEETQWEFIVDAMDWDAV